LNEHANESLVSLQRVSRRYQRGSHAVAVLNELNLEVTRGEFVAFMGPSGSGKSTLLNLIGGLDRPDRGRVLIDGRDIARYTDRQLTAWRAAYVGFVFQAYNLLPALTAEQNVALPLLLTTLGSVEVRRRARTALEIVGLVDRAAHRPAELSGGQEQRVSVARALVADPALVICDEPTGGLDRATADEILELLELLNRDHRKTVIMVTHDPKAATRAERVLHLDKGVLFEPAAAAQVAT
jgi:putative ABC transport system ATP-binding protein